MTTINNYPILSQNYLQNSQPAFRGVGSNSLSAQGLQPAQNTQTTNPQISSTLSYPPDTVEISAENKIKAKPKEKMSTGAKVGLTALGVVGGIALGTVCILKHQTGKLTKLYNEKMQLLDLPKHIDFKEAKTVEEGIKFAKEVLQIGEVDSNFTLEAINFANKGLVDISNANKGHWFVPKKMLYSDLKDNVLAHVIKDVESNRFGEFAINKRFFDNKIINESIDKNLFYDNKTKIFKFHENGTVSTCFYNGIPIVPSQDVQKLIQKYYKNPNEMNIEEKRLLSWSLRNGFDELYAKFERYPLDTIKQYQRNFEKELNININITDIAQKTTKEQEEILTKWTKDLRKNNKTAFNVKLNLYSPNKTIYHEMGHLQDFAKNLKELDLKQWKLPSFKECYDDVKNGRKHINNAELEHVDNRWDGTTYKGYQELLDKNPTKFKKRYPDLYEHLTNQEIQQTAGKVSWYAQTSIGEFIAEVYAKMVRGDKIPDDVMKLYKKYNGPTIPFS